MLNEREDSIIAPLVPAMLFVVLVVYLLMSDPLIIGPF
jgi:hypothetical protein